MSICSPSQGREISSLWGGWTNLTGACSLSGGKTFSSLEDVPRATTLHLTQKFTFSTLAHIHTNFPWKAAMSPSFGNPPYIPPGSQQNLFTTKHALTGTWVVKISLSDHGDVMNRVVQLEMLSYPFSPKAHPRYRWEKRGVQLCSLPLPCLLAVQLKYTLGWVHTAASLPTACKQPEGAALVCFSSQGTA